MTTISKMATFFPALHIGLIVFLSILSINTHHWLYVISLISVTYLLPPLIFKFYTLYRPQRSGKWILNNAIPCEWWIAHQLQMTYACLPVLESVLRLLPGVYSFWLRLWGSEIGNNVYWTVNTELLDRHLIHVGNNVVFGHRVQCTAHIITRKSNGDTVLLASPIKIGNNCFLGAKCRIGPGVDIPSGSITPYDTEYRFSYDK